MESELLMQISGSISVAVSILSTLWIFRHRHAYGNATKIIAAGIAIYTISHLSFHTIEGYNIPVVHILVDDGFLIITALLNAMNWRK